jgi:heme O synthase-like polyprenyltransferase
MEKKTNGMSIAAIIFAFIMPVVGLILAIIAKKNDPDDKLAKAAFIISIVILAIGLVSSIGCAACTACAAASMEGTYAAVLAL